MRSQACNVMLDQFEEVRKDRATGEYYDLCNECLGTVKQSVFELQEEKVDYSVKVLDKKTP